MGNALSLRQAHHRHCSKASLLVCTGSFLAWSTGNYRESQGEVSHQPHALTSASQGCSEALHNSVCFHFQMCFGEKQKIKAKDTFCWERTAWPRVVFTAPEASPPTLVRCPLLPYPLEAGVGGHLPTLATVYW